MITTDKEIYNIYLSADRHTHTHRHTLSFNNIDRYLLRFPIGFPRGNSHRVPTRFPCGNSHRVTTIPIPTATLQEGGRKEMTDSNLLSHSPIIREIIFTVPTIT